MMIKRKTENILVAFGMIGTLIYLFHIMYGARSWVQYDAMTMNIARLTATDSPNGDILRLFTILYAALMVLFAVGLLMRALRSYNGMLKTAFILLLIGQIIGLIGYSFFPINFDISMLSFYNVMHRIIYVVVIVIMIFFSFFAAFGYLQQSGLRKLGKLVLVMAVMITLFSILRLIVTHTLWPIWGLTDRLMMFSMMFLFFAISNFEAFTITPYND